MKNKTITQEQQTELLAILQVRFEKNKQRHTGLNWKDVEAKLISQSDKIWSLYQMEQTGGEPDVVAFDNNAKEFIFYDCAEESPKGRRSLCYDRAAWETRKEHKPADNAIDVAKEMGIEILTEEQYRHLQTLGQFDRKTSSWVLTPAEIRKLGGAVFCDRRYNTVFLYHNGAESYYAARGFRGLLRV